MKIFTLFFFLFGVVAFGLGIYMLLDKSLLNMLDPTVRMVFAILLVLYGIFRISTSIGAMRKNQQPTTK